MTPQQLSDFDAACRRSMRDGDDYLDQLLAAEPDRSCAVKGGTKRVYVVERIGADFSNKGFPITDALRDLLMVANVGPELHKLRKLHESMTPHPTRVPSAIFVLHAETGTSCDLDVQALACLRLLHSGQSMRFLRPYAWVTDLASAKLGRLLAEHPVLMHPRLVWDTDPRISQLALSNGHWDGEPAPMMQSIYKALGKWSLPSAHAGIHPTDIERFALHPAVAAGIKARAPHLIESFPPAKPVTWGKTLGDMVSSSFAGRTPFFEALLRIERLRHARVKDKGLFTGSEGMRSGLRHGIELTFLQSWVKDAQEGMGSAREAFFTELSKSPTLPVSSMCRAHLLSAPHMFFDTANLATRQAGVKVPLGSMAEAPDSAARFGRLRHALMASGLAEDPAHATRLVVCAAFPTEAEAATWPLSTGTSVASVQTAHDFILQCEANGTSLDEMSGRIRRNNEGTSWGQALDVLETQRRMTAVINAAPATALSHGSTSDSPTDHAAPTARRRLRNL